MDSKKIIFILVGLIVVGFVVYKTVVMKKTTGIIAEPVVSNNKTNVGDGTLGGDVTDMTKADTGEKVVTPVDTKTTKEIYNEKALQSDVYFSTPDNSTLYEFISKFGTVDRKSATSKRQAKNFKMTAKLKGYVNGYLVKTRVYEDTNAVLKKNKYWIEFNGEYRRFVVTNKSVLQNYIYS